MLETLKARAKIKNWWEWIPVFGTIAYIVRVEHIRIKVEDKSLRRKFFAPRAIQNLLSFGIAIIFLILFLTLRNHHGFGAWPWFFWVGLAIGLIPNISPLVPQYLFNLGAKWYENSLNATNK